MWIARLAAVLIAIVGLAGCASGPLVVAADVRSTAAQPPGAAVLQAPHYRFEPGPQPVGQPSAEQLQALAQAALARVGAVRDDAHPAVSVQLAGSVNVVYAHDGWYGPYGPYGGWGGANLALGWGGRWRGGGGWGLGYGGPLWGPMWGPSVPVYMSEVSLVMRDLQSGQIVYSTQARHDGTWPNTDAVLAALYAAALQGYAAPPTGPRRVDVPLQPMAEAPPPPAAAAASTPAQP